jgi:hypothetical protein
MKTLFILDHFPIYEYITEDVAQKEYQEYIRSCEHQASQGFTSTMMWLNFEQWLTYMEYLIA